jgi:glyoxylase I family protein
MKIKLHHVNFCSANVPEMDRFYRTVLNLEPEPSLQASRVTGSGYAGNVAFVTDGTTQLHLAEIDFNIGFRTNNAINPLERGHIAFRTDDLAAFKRHLAERGIPFSDYGAWAMNGWEQIFFHDPEGNVIEVHQDHSSDASWPAGRNSSNAWAPRRLGTVLHHAGK